MHSWCSLTKCYNIEDLHCFIRSCCSKTAAVGTHTGAVDLAGVGTEFLDKLNALCHFLPKLYKPIDGAGYDKFSEWGDSHERQLVLVHERFGVPGRGGQGPDVDLLEGQLSSFLFGRHLRW